MADMWDIARYVEEHPEDHEQRWRLAKKLYVAWEYRLALEHLQVLRNEWGTRVNVARYLAATYYRLGRYDEAGQELQRAIETWPDELGLREQYARVLEVAGDRKAAAKVWEDIHAIDPHHPIAESAINRLLREPEAGEGPADDLQLGSSDSGISLRPGRTCQQCGAQNGENSDLCWNCGTPLFTVKPTPRDARSRAAQCGAEVTVEQVNLGAGMLVVALLAAALYCVLRYVTAYRMGAEPPLIERPSDLYLHGFFVSRLAVSLVLLVAWPMAALFALNVFTLRAKVPGPAPVLTALFGAAVVILALWLPMAPIAAGLALALTLTFFVVVVSFRLGLGPGLGVWGIQTGVTLLAVASAVWGIESWQTGKLLNPLREVAAITDFMDNDHGGENGIHRLPQDAAPIDQPVVWPASGSDWIDHFAEQVLVSVSLATPADDVRLEVTNPTGTHYFARMENTTHKAAVRIDPGTPYRVQLTGAPGTEAHITLTSLLTPVFSR